MQTNNQPVSVFAGVGSVEVLREWYEPGGKIDTGQSTRSLYHTRDHDQFAGGNAASVGNVSALTGNDNPAAGFEPVIELGHFDLVAFHIVVEGLFGKFKCFRLRVDYGFPDRPQIVIRRRGAR